ncbi:MAG TPA: protein kinase [Ktedonobacteraceae bacterium]|nr:protein kinase [Ktedonobacteraceae bacterium]
MPGLAGTSLGRYHLLQRLGRGGMSEVYLAHDELMNRDVAIKVVSSMHADYIERFHREAEAIGRLNHDHILPAYDYGEQEPWHYLVMPHIEYGTLRERVIEGPLSLIEVDELFEQIASGLQFAHDQGIIHRDIKPSNILLRDDHYVYIADFGLAKSLEGGDTVTLSGSLLGTPEYMAPELAEGPATTSSDIYALGILLYQMVTGQVPFSGETPLAVYFKQLRDDPLPPSALNPEIPPAIERVILRTLDKDPRRRYRTAEAVAHAFHKALMTQDMEDYAGYTAQEPVYDVSQRDAPVEYNVTRGQEALLAHNPYASQAPSQEGRLVLPGDPYMAPAAVQPVRRRLIRRSASPTPNLNRERKRFRRVPAQAMAVDPLTPLPMRKPVETETEMPTVEQNSIQTPPAHRNVGRTGRPTRSGSMQRTRPAPGRRRKRLNPVTIAGLIGVGLLLLISIPFFVFYNQASKNLQMETATANAQATASAKTSGAATQATATAGVAATAVNRTLILSDPLSSNTNGRWNADSVSCAFTSGSYHVYVKQASFLQPCESTNLPLANFTLLVDVSLLSGNDAGVILRVNGTQFYDFEITNQGQFFFRRHDASNGYVMLIDRTKSSAIAPVGQKNTLLVIANGNDFKLYINGTFVGEQQDSTSTINTGQIGFVAGTLSATSGEASFSNLKIYQNR